MTPRGFKGTFLTTKQLAGRWGMSVGTIQNWRWRGEGPFFLKWDHLILYPLAEVRIWEKNSPEIMNRARARTLEKKT